ncbi:PEP-utilizing enzyme [Synechococcus sp. PCC 6716]|nr:PEP-utilizing enzyme [Synechococcus sp. PCC 6716]
MPLLTLETLQRCPAELLAPALACLQRVQQSWPPPHPVWVVPATLWHEVHPALVPLWEQASEQWQATAPNHITLKALATEMSQRISPLDVGELPVVFEACHHYWQQQGGDRHLVITSYLWLDHHDLPWGIGSASVLTNPSMPVAHHTIEVAYRQVVQARNLYTYWQQGWNVSNLRVAVLIYPLATVMASGWWCSATGGTGVAYEGVHLPHHGHLPGNAGELPTDWQTLVAQCPITVQPYLWLWHQAYNRVWVGQCLAEPYSPEQPPAPLQRSIVGEGIPAAPGQAIAPALVITDPCAPSAVVGRILVTKTIPPHWLPLVSAAAGIICEQGGLTSHGAILARELSRPAVVGVPNATQTIASGTLLFLDGNSGAVYQLPPQPLRAEVTATTQPQQPPARGDRLPLQILVNVSQVSALRGLRSLPCDGIGLVRSELMLLSFLDGRHPCHWLQQGDADELRDRWVHHLTQLMRAIAPRPVFYRTLDLRAEDYRHLLGGASFESESHPAFGLRGVSRYPHFAELFDLELEVLAIAHRLEDAPLRVILPFVRSVSEVAYCQAALARHHLTQAQGIELWVMAEVPAILFLMSDLAALGISGITIGTNDLTQLLLGVDRERVLHEFNDDHPAVKGAIAQLIQQAKALKLRCSLCGEALIHHRDWLPWLVELGLDSISVSPEAVLQVWAQLTR